MDESIGLVVQGLSKAGMLENTIIVFTSDNGGAPEGYDSNQGSNWPLRGVRQNYPRKMLLQGSHGSIPV